MNVEYFYAGKTVNGMHSKLSPLNKLDSSAFWRERESIKVILHLSAK